MSQVGFGPVGFTAYFRPARQASRSRIRPSQATRSQVRFGASSPLPQCDPKELSRALAKLGQGKTLTVFLGGCEISLSRGSGGDVQVAMDYNLKSEVASAAMSSYMLQLLQDKGANRFIVTHRIDAKTGTIKISGAETYLNNGQKECSHSEYGPDTPKARLVELEGAFRDILAALNSADSKVDWFS